MNIAYIQNEQSISFKMNREILHRITKNICLYKSLLTADFYINQEGVFIMTLQESYRRELNKRGNYKGALSYYLDDSLTPEQRIEKAHQEILDRYYEKQYQLQFEKELEEKVMDKIQETVDDLLKDFQIDIKI